MLTKGNKMKIFVFGATGRVGQEFVSKALAENHKVTVFVRSAANLKFNNVQVYEGDARDAKVVTRALKDGFDAVVTCLGERSLKASNLIQESMVAIIAGMKHTGIKRLLVVSGTAEMPHKTTLGKLYTALLKQTPVGHAVRDHDAAFAWLKATDLDWTLAGCNYLRSGPEKGKYKESMTFPGGFKIIHPPDVADFLIRELHRDTNYKAVVGLWY